MPMTSLFLNCDWGTSRFRLRLVDGNTHAILLEQTSDQGIASFGGTGSTKRSQSFQQVLESQLDQMATACEYDLTGVPVLISGMASSSIGWQELPYSSVPFGLDGSTIHSVRLDDENWNPGRPVYLFSGVSAPGEVMRGEEIELLGVATLVPELILSEQEIWVLLPGTHSKHIRVLNGTMTGFHTHMTGELFQLLSQQSSLKHRDRHLLTRNDSSRPSSSVQAAFTEGLESAQLPGLGASLFQVRTRQLLKGESAADSAGFLSGLLIGDELLNLKQCSSADSSIVLAASRETSELYQQACSALGLQERLKVIPAQDVARLSAIGQYRAYRQAETEVL